MDFSNGRRPEIPIAENMLINAEWIAIPSRSSRLMQKRVKLSHVEEWLAV
jgi:hypothetical protein